MLTCFKFKSIEVRFAMSEGKSEFVVKGIIVLEA